MATTVLRRVVRTVTAGGVVAVGVLRITEQSAREARTQRLQRESTFQAGPLDGNAVARAVSGRGAAVLVNVLSTENPLPAEIDAASIAASAGAAMGTAAASQTGQPLRH